MAASSEFLRSWTAGIFCLALCTVCILKCTSFHWDSSFSKSFLVFSLTSISAHYMISFWFFPLMLNWIQKLLWCMLKESWSHHLEVVSGIDLPKGRHLHLIGSILFQSGHLTYMSDNSSALRVYFFLLSLKKTHKLLNRVVSSILMLSKLYH